MSHNHCASILSLGLKIALAAMTSLDIPLSSGAYANPHEFKLANGLRLIVKEDHRSPVVISQIWYKAGSIDELNGATGIAHALEHAGGDKRDTRGDKVERHDVQVVHPDLQHLRI